MSTRLRVALATMTAVVGLVGCGGHSGADGTRRTAAGARAVAREYLADFKNHDYAAACALHTPAGLADLKQSSGVSGSCESVLTFAGAVGDRSWIDRALKKIETVKVTVRGNRAVVAATSPGDDPSYLLYVRGRWRYDVAPRAKGAPVADANPAAAAARKWPSRWCELQIGMTAKQAAAIMGPPTETQKAAVGVGPDVGWSFGNLLFIAFLDDSGKINQLLNNNAARLSARERAQIHCADRRP